MCASRCCCSRTYCPLLCRPGEGPAVLCKAYNACPISLGPHAALCENLTRTPPQVVGRCETQFNNPPSSAVPIGSVCIDYLLARQHRGCCHPRTTAAQYCGRVPLSMGFSKRTDTTAEVRPRGAYFQGEHNPRDFRIRVLMTLEEKHWCRREATASSGEDDLHSAF